MNTSVQADVFVSAARVDGNVPWRRKISSWVLKTGIKGARNESTNMGYKAMQVS